MSVPICNKRGRLPVVPQIKGRRGLRQGIAAWVYGRITRYFIKILKIACVFEVLGLSLR